MTIPDSVTNIGSGVFSNCGLISVTIPASVTNIGQDVVKNNYNLSNVTFIGKTLEQVQNIEDESGTKQYPWGIVDTSIINTWNDASQEWVTSQLPTKTSQLSNDSGFTTQTYVDDKLHYEVYSVPSSTLLLKDRACNTFPLLQDTTFIVPLSTSIYGKCMDFLLCLTIAQGTVPNISFTKEGVARWRWAYEGDTFPKPDSAGLWLYSFTQIDELTIAVSLKKLTIAPF